MNRLWRTISVLLALQSQTCELRSQEAGAGKDRDFRVVGYLPEYRVDGFDASVCKPLTDVIFFSLQPTADDGLNRTQLNDEERQLLRAIREQGPRIHVSLGGGGRSEHFAAATAATESRAKLVKSLNRFVTEHKFDGVDVDWEFPANEKQRVDFVLLLGELEASLRPDGRELSIAVAGAQELPPAAIEAVDFVHLMAYDGEGLHSTFDFAAEQVGRVLDRGVPANKLCLGVPFYGRGIDRRDRALTYAEIIRRHHPVAEADEVAGYYFNGPRTVERKVQFAIDKGLAGVMVWEIGQDSQDESSLLSTIHRAISVARP